MHAGLQRSTGDRQISTCEVDYYHWTQWLFLKLHERGLAYLAEVPVNWCPAQGTVLANEEVQDGKYVETGDPVERRMMRQWMLKITAYAERLLDDLSEVWTGPRAWSKCSASGSAAPTGAEVNLRHRGPRAHVIHGLHHPTRHPVRRDLLRARPRAPAGRKNHHRRTAAGRRRGLRRRTRHETAPTSIARWPPRKKRPACSRARTPSTRSTASPFPIWVADYVLMTYGTGRDHGGARPRRARPRLRQQVRICRSARWCQTDRGPRRPGERLVRRGQCRAELRRTSTARDRGRGSSPPSSPGWKARDTAAAR